MKTVLHSKKIVVGLCVLMMKSMGLSAATRSSVELTGGVDFVSKYVWRGVYQAGASLQPNIGVGYAGLSLSAWSSTTLGSSQFKELDMTVKYSVAGLSLSVTDYYWNGEKGSFYDHYMDNHLLEGTLSYQFGSKFPLYVSWSTFFAGHMDQDKQGAQQYSSYFEVGYDFCFREVDFTVLVGGAPWSSYAWLTPVHGGKGFQISQFALRAAKEIRFSSKYSATVFVQGVASPATDMAHLIVGVSF